MNTATAERDIEAYLHRRVRKLGGDYRRVKWIGVRGAPDDLVGVPFNRTLWDRAPFNALVECKRPGEEPEPHQLREHERLRSWGLVVYIVATAEEIDAILPLPKKGK